MNGKLTKARAAALTWLRDNGPTHLFPASVNLRLLQKMAKEPEGLVLRGETYSTQFRWPMVQLSISDLGRAALKQGEPM